MVREGATTLRGWVEQLDTSPVGGGARSSLIRLESELTPAVTAGAASELAEAIQSVAAQVVTALQGLATGLDTAASAYRQVDVVTGAAAEQLAPAPPPGLQL